MAIQEMELDPNAAAYTDDEIVGKVNTASANITRAGSVEATARPIETGDGGDVRDAVIALSDAERGLVMTDPQSGEFTVVSIQRKANGKLGAKYDDTAQ